MHGKRIGFVAMVGLICFICFAVPSLVFANQESVDESIDFKTEVIPVLTKLGCNAGACHGSAAGRGGFKLSLYGSQPEDDYIAMVRQQGGRRINLASPEKSLLIRKPVGELEHGGEQRFDYGDDAELRLTQWIREGAQLNKKSALTSFKPSSESFEFAAVGERAQVKFMATFADGIETDVTAWTILESSDSASLEVDDSTHDVVIRRPGRHLAIARFLDRVVSIEFLLPYEDSEATPSPGPSSDTGEVHPIDARIDEKLKQLNLAALPSATDSVFLRRVYLDLTGRLPTPEQVFAFARDDHPDKRLRLIRALISSDAFDDYLTWQLAGLLRIRSQPADKIGVAVYHHWLRQQVANDRPWDELVQTLLLSTGDSHLLGPANFYRTTSDGRLQSEFVTESMLGVKLRCANCHDHPLDRWTQDDYHGLAAIFAKVNQGRVISINPGGENIHARTGVAATPRIPGVGFLDRDADNREAFAKWLTSKENKMFSSAIVNRLWRGLMGRGLVDPVDDLRATNPPTHPELLDFLADDFVEHDFSLRHTMELICSSDAYQRASKTGKAFAHLRTYYAAQSARPLAAEVLFDAINDVTGNTGVFPGFPDVQRAIELPDSKVPSTSLDLLGRCAREESCDSAGGESGGLATQLHLLNGDLINQRIELKSGRLQELIRVGKSDEAIVETIYLAAYGRIPSDDEREFWRDRLASGNVAERSSMLQDFFWSVLNSREFTTNH